jgi:hypothetical protein
MMKTILFLIGITTVCLVLFWTHSLPGLGGDHTVKELLANPREFFDKEVTVTGVVGDAFAVMGTGYFQLKDADGSELAVLSKRGIPAQGQKTSVRGTLRQALAVGSVQMLVFVESPKPTGESTAEATKKR